MQHMSEPARGLYIEQNSREEPPLDHEESSMREHIAEPKVDRDEERWS